MARISGGLELRVEKLEDKVEKLSEATVRNDERYKTLIDLFSGMQKSLSKISDDVIELKSNFKVNDHITKENRSWIKDITVGKIITVIVGIITVIAFIKSY